MVMAGAMLLPVLLSSCMYLTPEGRELMRKREQYQATREKMEAVNVTRSQIRANMPKAKITAPKKTVSVQPQSPKSTTTSAGGKSVQELELEVKKKQDVLHQEEKEIFSEL